MHEYQSTYCIVFSISSHEDPSSICCWVAVRIYQLKFKVRAGVLWRYVDVTLGYDQQS